MAESRFRERPLYTVLFSFVLTFSIAFILTGAHLFTTPIVEDNELERRQGAVLRAMGIHLDDRDDVFATYSRLDSRGDGLYRYSTEDDRLLIARVFSGPGVWGQIQGVIGVDAAARRIIGVEILDHQETPGLGGRVADARFLSQLQGERFDENGIVMNIRGPGNYDPDDGRIDGITGATGTTRAFDRILRRKMHLLWNDVRTLSDEA